MEKVERNTPEIVITIDDFLSESDNKIITDVFLSNHGLRWTETDMDIVNNRKSLVSSIILNEVNKHFSLRQMIGYETWARWNNSIPDWHYDVDEQLWQREKIMKNPICGAVYYSVIKDLVGGEFVTETHSIKPRANMLLIFGPKIYHKVNQYTGERMGIAFNPWTYKPNEYNIDSRRNREIF